MPTSVQTFVRVARAEFNFGSNIDINLELLTYSYVTLHWKREDSNVHRVYDSPNCIRNKQYRDVYTIH